ncbi:MULTISPECIES: penicillin-binding transpeptidase domain-containing protein [unclassified Arcicella]|uniref:penicillin-binding transpeptidase domain-containing protein n=1 Tax=unclassified Arcicella TaxID=2644986 RepID=UPI0028645822|nr:MULTISPECIES: penicillin-binding transpeptidase domain-containing protein [unclassified Arcicella]MDR6563418.1 penicillin-binding protein 2 [Arcicella sp. BE51]MDR6813161.1 penicillin-binding protein 2 [Arcicella sp. BE140]MDR6824475.1 penicillin-binding protein 2 [Arcicella sp. BE139]
MDELRKRFIQGFFILIGLIYICRLFFLQVVDETYKLDAENNAIRKIIQSPFRGLVYDRNKKLIVSNTVVYDLYITPKKAKVADTLKFCSIFGITRQSFDSLTHLARIYSPVRPSLFLRQLSREDFAKVQDAMVDYPGFEFQLSAVRTYDSKAMANALGYVGEISPERLEKLEEEGDEYYRQGDYIGVTGLERFYEEDLRGERGIKYMMVNSRGVEKGPFKGGAFDKNPIAGKNLLSSIDINLQAYADSLMQHKVGSVVAIEPSSGEVLAMVSAPTYDPSQLSGRTFSKYFQTLNLNPLHPLLNRPPSAYYRPGSTFKIIQALVALQMGVISPGTGFGHAGSPIRCSHNHPVASDVQKAIQYSCNPYFYQTYKRMIYNNSEKNIFKKSALGLQKWDEMVAKFGIGQSLEIDLPNEKKGKLPDVKYYDKMYKGALSWKFSNIASNSIGEGEIIVNPLKMANVAAIIANRGWYIRPHLVKGIDQFGEIDPKYKEKISVGIDKRHFNTVIDGMVLAVNNGTVSGDGRMNDIQMCGKTGTSQNRHGENHSIFIAFAPKENPKIAIAVFVENAGSGGAHAAPIASLCIEKYIKGHVDRKAIETKWMNKSYPNMLTVRNEMASKAKTKMKPDTAQKVDEELFLTTPTTITLPLGGSPKTNEVKIPMSPKKTTTNIKPVEKKKVGH